MTDTPDISYPCDWDYTVIAEGGRAAERAVRAAVGQREHRVSPPTASRGGKYTSLRIRVRVDDQRQRDAIFMMLRNSDGVRMVL